MTDVRKVVVVLAYERDTKNNARFNEGGTVVRPDGLAIKSQQGSEVVGRMYLRHAEHVLLGKPQRIRVTIESADA